MRPVALLLLLLLFATPAWAEGMEPAVGVPGDGAAAQSLGAAGPVGMGNFGFFAGIFTAVNGPIQAGATAASGALAGWVRGWFVTAATLVLLCLLIASAIRLPEAAYDWLTAFALRAIGVSMVAASSSGYQQWVAAPLLALPGQLTPIVTTSGTSFAGGGQPFDQLGMALWTGTLTTLAALPFSWTGIIVGVCLAIGALFGFLFIGAAFCFYLMTFTIFDLLIAIGPIFVATLLARVTRVFFAGWLGAIASQLAALLLIAVLLGIMMAVIKTNIAGILNAPADSNSLAAAGGLLSLTGSLFVLVWASFKVSNIAVGVTSGVGNEWLPAVARTGQAAYSSFRSMANSLTSSGSGSPAPAAASGFAGRSISGSARS